LHLKCFTLQQYRPAHGGQGAPPPYPGRGGPTHGYGEGRGHYNRARPSEPPVYPNNQQAPRRPQPQGGRSSSQQANRGSRIETQPMR
jgi:hypothetical protein